MNTYIKINSINYPAEIYGHVRDRDWDNRESKVIILSMTIEEALALFTDNVQWSIVYDTQTIPQDDFIIAGPITDNRNGTVSVRMGKPTATEVSNVITGGAVDLPTAYAMRAVIEESVASLDDETAVTVPHRPPLQGPRWTGPYHPGRLDTGQDPGPVGCAGGPRRSWHHRRSHYRIPWDGVRIRQVLLRPGGRQDLPL